MKKSEHNDQALQQVRAAEPGAAEGGADVRDVGEPGAAVRHNAPNGTGPPEQTPEQTLMRLAEVEALVRIKRSAIYRCMRDGMFPKNIKIAGASFWVRSEIQRHIAAAMEARDASAKH